MAWLGNQPHTIFLGQGVGNPGTSLSDTLDDVPGNRRIEMPVAEEMQVGICIGLSLQGMVPVCIIPRWNFALRAADQIVNHLDRLPLYSDYKPKVLIRIAVPSVWPFDPGPQHDADFTEAFRRMLRTTAIVTLTTAAAIVPAYQQAYRSDRSTILVEYTDLYKNARA